MFRLLHIGLDIVVTTPTQIRCFILEKMQSVRTVSVMANQAVFPERRVNRFSIDEAFHLHMATETKRGTFAFHLIFEITLVNIMARLAVSVGHCFVL